MPNNNTPTSTIQPKKISQPLTIYDTALRKMSRYQDIKHHHGNGKGQTAYSIEKSPLSGKKETYISTGATFEGSDGKTRTIKGEKRLVKDIILQDRNGSFNPGVPSGVDGYVFFGEQNVNGTTGAGRYVYIVDKIGPDGKPAEDAKVIFRAMHLDSFNPSLKAGDRVEVGTIIGNQGKTGTKGIHSHIEMPEANWENYFKMLQTGKVVQNDTVQSPNSKSYETSRDKNFNIDIEPSNRNSTTDVSKVVTFLQRNSDAIKKDYGYDVSTPDGLGKAVMHYWQENNLNPQILVEQLSNVTESDIKTGSDALLNVSNLASVKNNEAQMSA
jgi:hypothetical protein